MFVWGLGGLVAHERRAGALVSTALLGAFHLLAGGCTACAAEHPFGSAAAAAPSASGTPLKPTTMHLFWSATAAERLVPSLLFLGASQSRTKLPTIMAGNL